MQKIQALDIQKLTHKLVMLMTVILGRQKAQTIHSIRVSDIKILDNKVVIPIMSLIKQTKPTKDMAPLCFQIYNKEPKLCVVTHLTQYLKRTKIYRDTEKLFLICIKPYSAASKDTIFRWCKSIIKESGISIHSYTSHSSTAADSSYVEHHYAQSFKVQVGTQRGHLPNFTKNKSKKKLSFKIICNRKIILYKKIVKVDLYKKYL